MSNKKTKKSQESMSRLEAPEEAEKTLGSLKVGNARIGSLEIPVPGFMATLTGPEDLKALLMRDIPRRRIHGIVIEQHNSDSIRREVKKHDEDHLVGEGVKWSTYKKGKLIMFDPNPEIFYLARPNLRKRLSETTGAPRNFFTRMAKADTSNHVSLWNDALSAQEYLGVLVWQKKLQMGMGNSQMVVPLTPFIDANDMAAVNACLNANIEASEKLKDILGVPRAMYIAVNYSALKDDSVSQAIFTKLYTYFKTKPKPDALIIKIRRLPSVDGEDKNGRLEYVARFLEAMGALADEFEIPLFLFNAGSYGLAALEYGFNSFSERLNGSFLDPNDPDPEMTGMPKEKRYGSVYNPVNKTNTPYAKYVASTDPHPHVEFSTPPDPKDVSDRNFRLHAKHYRVAARGEEVHKVVDSVFEENPRALAEEFQRSKASNVQKILKNPI